MAERRTLTAKILGAHCAGGLPEAGETARFRADSVLFHDMSAILAFLAYDAMGRGRAGVPLPFVFTDHNLVGMDPQTANDQAFVRSGAAAFGMGYAPAGSGICHTLYSEHIGKPGLLLIGADSHTATCGALGMLGIGLGGMQVARAMTGDPLPLPVPRVIRILLEGALPEGVTAMDAALALLARLGIRGALGAVLEYAGEGAAALSVPQRQTFCNLGAEMGATASIFPADEAVSRFLASQGREADFSPLAADDGAAYDETIAFDLSLAEPMVALPGRPDRGVPVREAERVSFSQIFIGSCANGSYEAIASAAAVLSGRHVAPGVQLLVACGSRRILRQIISGGVAETLLASGARILESACGPCMGIGSTAKTRRRSCARCTAKNCSPALPSSIITRTRRTKT